MPNFDYIASPAFRQSLENDFNELELALANKAWKASQVLAGSIVEALLIDYIQSTNNPGRKAVDPLKISLAEAIDICLDEDVITKTTSDLCSVVKSYRNLIHPGRVVRLGESPPSPESANVALSLVKIITSELESFRRRTGGTTAEEILYKIEHDKHANLLIKHLLPEVSAHQQERLLLDLIPQAYNDSLTDDFADPDRLTRCYRVILDTVDESIRRKVAQKFVHLVRTGEGHLIERFRDAFFKARDLEYVQSDKVEMIKTQLLNEFPLPITKTRYQSLEGIGTHLSEKEAIDWIDALIRSYTGSNLKFSDRAAALSHAKAELRLTKAHVDKLVLKRCQEWFEAYAKKPEWADRTKFMETFRDEIEAFVDPIPF